MYHFRKDGSFYDMLDFMNNNYVKPYTRAAPYAMGGLLAFIFHKTRKPKLNTVLVVLLWIIAIVAGYFAFQGKGFENISNKLWSKQERYAYEILFRPVWGLCLCWVLWACHFGYGGIINRFLSIKYFVTISKLGYGVYMIHWVILSYIFFVARYRRHVDHVPIVRFQINSILYCFNFHFYTSGSGFLINNNNFHRIICIFIINV